MASYVGKMEAQLQQWGASIDTLVGQADEVAAAARFDYRQHIADQQARYRAAEVKLNELRSVSNRESVSVPVVVERY